jgi:acyl-CoA dehydrogenase
VAGAAAPPGGAGRLVEALAQLQSLRAQVSDAVQRFERIADDVDALSSIPFALTMNQLKLAVSSGAIGIVGQAMLVAGLAGYRNDSPESLGRHLRDIHSAALMIGNERIIGNSAALLAAYRGEETLYP